MLIEVNLDVNMVKKHIKCLSFLLKKIRISILCHTIFQLSIIDIFKWDMTLFLQTNIQLIIFWN